LFCYGLQEDERVGPRVKVTAGGLLVTAFIAGTVLGILALAVTVPLNSLAAPTPLCKEEVVAVATLFLVYVAVARPVSDALNRSKSSVSGLMRRKVEVPGPVRVACLALFIFGSFVFAFWATADVLTGYHGYSYTFFAYPILASINNDVIGMIPYISSRDKGTQASFFIGVAALGLVLFRLNRGFGAALKDAVSLFLAPCLVVFELALWRQAPDDMTWHVTDFLSMGGLADGGYRINDFFAVPFVNYPPNPGGYVGTYVGGTYIFSNWFVLSVALFLVATRVPWTTLPSTLLWRRKRTGLQEGDGAALVARSAGPAKDGGPAGRRLTEGCIPATSDKPMPRVARRF